MDKSYLSSLTILGLALAGCTSAPTAYQRPDTANTPKHETAVIQASTEVTGSLLPDFRGSQTVYTRKDRRTIENKTTLDAWWGKMLGGDQHSADIFRLDQAKATVVNFNLREYYECEISECPSLINMLDALGSSAEGTDQPEAYDPEDNTSCPLTMTKNSFTVEDTGQRKTLNGYPTKLYQAKWELVQQDSSQRQNQNSLQIDFWTTPPDADIQKVWQIHDQITDAYIKEAELGNSPLAKFLPESIFRSLSVFSGDTSGQSQQWDNEVSQKLASIEGYPINIDLNWYADNNACQDETTPAAQTSSATDPLGALKDMAGNMMGEAVAKQLAPDASEPVLSYRYHITSARIEQVSDSIFEVPAEFSKKPQPSWTQQNQ